jgi:hypothetical protein
MGQEFNVTRHAEALRPFRIAQQGFHFAPQGVVAGLAQEGVPLALFAVEGRLAQPFDCFQRSGSSRFSPESSRSSQIRASRQSRKTLSCDIFNTSAVSLTPSPS